ncbi:CHAT domain-containing protein [Microbispora sp. SCL1-1]|uniref:CHAT domain-containing tetratricopeptide repeat protein n=1 Tax=unclassified Microbispora TaxID=2614687 RepID=UPI0011590609|nr:MULTISPECIES: CHAT domain-containing tetratricopeptide repeat protein [unclassified Microbispora]NJP23590.1 CHAT domain-containing protein [Microbispora sp. CL1-1]TQS15815.1 CHAT domain-containing protein [Microbispora sp. SCL1-1]
MTPPGDSLDVDPHGVDPHAIDPHAIDPHGVDLLGRAEAAVRLSATDPRLALVEARAVLDLAGWPGPAGAYGEAASVALRATALAARELGDLELAGERLEEAIAAGRGFPRRVAQARMSLVTVRAQLGDPEGGLRLADLAERDLSGADLARLGVQRSVALILLGRHEEAVRHCDRAIGLLGDDAHFRAGGLLNRGLAHAYRERYAEAEADLAECARLARSAGLDHVAMLAEGNLPFVAARRGDIAAAFARYQAAEATLFGFPERLAVMRTDFAEALLAARMPGEARTLLEQAVPELVAAGAQAAVPGARLLLAQAALLAGDATLAAATARTALAELDAQGRTAWLPLAREVVLRARLAETPAPPDAPAHEASDAESLVTDLVACAGELAVCGWPAASAALRLTAAAAAVRLGAITQARAQLDHAATATRPLVRWHAVAMRHRLDGDLDQALIAAARGIEAVHSPGDAGPLDDQAGPHGDTAGPHGDAAGPIGDAAGPRDSDAARDAELRVHAARPAEDLAALGLEIALDRARRTGDARTVLEWAERWRAVVRGAPVPAPLLHGSMPTGSGPHGNPPAGSGLLVELVRRGDDLFAVTAGSGGCTLRFLGSYQAAVEATVRIRYGLRRRALLDTLPRPGRNPEPNPMHRTSLGPEHNTLPYPERNTPLGPEHDALPYPERNTPLGPEHNTLLNPEHNTPPNPMHGTPLGPGRNTPPGPRRDTPPDAPLDYGRSTLRDAPGGVDAFPMSVDEGLAGELYALDHVLLSGPGTLSLAGSPPGSPVTIVPTGALYTLPWPLLPSLRGRPVSVAADATVCLASRRGPAGAPLVLSLAGPGLDHAEAEADMVAAAHTRGRRIGATRAEVLRAIEQADVLHIAAHGMFSPRGPMLSQITLDDGPLMAYDLLTARRIPRLVVLSACDAGMAHAPVDGAALGLAGAFLDSAARNGDAACVVAGVVPVRDDEARTLMTLFHTLLAEGRSPAEALAQAAEKTAVPGFVCFGAGDEPFATS